MQEKDRYAALRGEGNPMRNPEVAAKQSASLRATLASPAKKAAMKKASKERWTLEQREQQAERARAAWAKGRPPIKWSEERKQKQTERMQVYWAKVRAGLELLENTHHADKNATK